MSKTNDAISRLNSWLIAGDNAQDEYGYHGAGRMPIETDIRILLDSVVMMKETLEKAEIVLEGVMMVRRHGDILATIRETLKEIE